MKNADEMTDDNPPESSQETESGTSAAPKRALSRPYTVGIVVLGIWILVFIVYGLDRFLGLGFFPTKLERLLQANVAKLTDEDAKVAEKAEQELFDYHGFAVPVLIKGIRSGPPKPLYRYCGCHGS